MPSVSVAPAQFQITWGTPKTEPARVTPGGLRLGLTMGDVSAGPNAGSSLVALNLSRLSRIVSMFPIVEPDGKATRQFQLQLQKAFEQIEAVVNSLSLQVNTNTSILAALQAANAKAEAANDNATTVQTRIALSESWTEPANVLTATNDGTVTIAAHKRYYDASTFVNVNGSSITGCGTGSFVRVYYVDAGREGGAVAYQCTTDNIAQVGDTHVVGGVLVPSAGEPPATGSGTAAPGNPFPPEGRYSGDYLVP